MKLIYMGTIILTPNYVPALRGISNLKSFINLILALGTGTLLINIVGIILFLESAFCIKIVLNIVFTNLYNTRLYQ